jgi:hypothetical protein
MDQRFTAYVTALLVEDMAMEIHSRMGGDVRFLSRTSMESRRRSEPGARYYFLSALLGLSVRGAGASDVLTSVLDGYPDDWKSVGHPSFNDADGDNCYENVYSTNFSLGDALYDVGSRYGSSCN